MQLIIELRNVADIVYERKARFLSKLKYSSDKMLFKLFFVNYTG